MIETRFTYREVKLKQKHDLDTKVAVYNISRRFSTPSTWIFANLGISPNAITISSFFLCIIGFYFLSLGNYIYLIFGLLFFILFRIFDTSDGEVARLQNKISIEGIYFDRISHYLYTCCLGIGLGFGMYRLYMNDIYINLGFLFALVLVLENSIKDLLRFYLIERFPKKSNRFFSLSKTYSYIQEQLNKRIYSGHQWEKGNIISKLVGILPFQGIAYSDAHAPPILIVLAIFEYLLSIFFGFPFKYNIIGIVPVYILIVTISKIIWIVWFIYRIEKYRYITTTLNKV